MNPPTISPHNDSKMRRRIWIVEAYWFFQRSIARVAEEYRKCFPNEAAPSKSVIQANVRKLHDEGTLTNLSKMYSGRPSTSNTPENVERVEEFYAENPQVSLRRASQALEIPVTSLQRIVKTKIKLFPYKIQVFQELSPFDMQRRLDFSRQMIEMILNRSIETRRIWFSDEAHFWLTGYVNKQNCRFWAKENPRIFVTTTMKPQRVTAWCAVCEDGIFLEFIDETVNSERYTRLLEQKFIPFAHGLDAVDGHWFMQDGATPHRTNQVFEVLNEHFSDRVLGLDYSSRNGGVEWPPYSPDLNPCDFFLWGYLKDKVYRENPRTLNALKVAIRREVEEIGPQVRKKVISGFESRLHAVVEKEGAHIEPYLH